MEDNLRPEVSLAFSDLSSTTEGFKNELTRTNSDASALTAVTSKHTFHQNANARPFTEWTDEKHSLYLDSLEASFVNQLHHSTGLLAWSSDKKTTDLNAFQQLPTNTCDSSGRFLVLRDGCWQRINFRCNRPVLDNAADSHNNVDSPWVRHFKCTGKGRTIVPGNLQYHSTSERMPTRGKRALSQRSITSQDQLSVCPRYHQDPVGSVADDALVANGSAWTCEKLFTDPYLTCEVFNQPIIVFFRVELGGFADSNPDCQAYPETTLSFSINGSYFQLFNFLSVRHITKARTPKQTYTLPSPGMRRKEDVL